jgi:hypothetical protein
MSNILKRRGNENANTHRKMNVWRQEDGQGQWLQKPSLSPS